MQKSESIKELAVALAKAQGCRFEESKIIPKVSKEIRPLSGRNQNSNIDVTWRFFEKITFGMSDCWYWRGSINQLGYGKTESLGEKQAHRFAWRLFKGEIPEGMHVLHKCDVRNCVNPEHLFLGTHMDNMRDCAAKKRNALSGKGKFGSKSPLAKLTEESVLEMRQLKETGISYKEIAKRYGVGTMTAFRAIKKISWCET